MKTMTLDNGTDFKRFCRKHIWLCLKCNTLHRKTTGKKGIQCPKCCKINKGKEKREKESKENIKKEEKDKPSSTNTSNQTA